MIAWQDTLHVWLLHYCYVLEKVAWAIIQRTFLKVLLFISVRIALDRNPILQFKQAKSLFFSMTEALRQIVRLGPHCPQGTSQTWLLWLLAPAQVARAPPCIISMSQLKKWGGTQQKYSHQVSLFLTYQENNNFPDNPQADFYILLWKMSSHGYS